MASLYQHPAQTRAQVIEAAHDAGYGRDENAASTGFMGAKSPPTHHHRRSSSNRRSKHNSTSLSRPRAARQGSGNVIPPAPGHNEIRAPTPRPASLPSQPVGSVLEEAASATSSDTTAVANTPARSPMELRGNGHSGHGHSHAKDADDAEQGHGAHDHDHDHSNGANGKKRHDHGQDHDGHAHGSGGEGHGHSHGGGGHGHSHGSMNMRGVFLHVLGDA